MINKYSVAFFVVSLSVALNNHLVHPTWLWPREGTNTDADGHTLPDANGHTLPDADGHTLPHADGHTLPDADGHPVSDTNGHPVSDTNSRCIEYNDNTAYDFINDVDPAVVFIHLFINDVTRTHNFVNIHDMPVSD